MQSLNLPDHISKFLKHPEITEVIVEAGETVDLSSLELKFHIPSIRQFRYVRSYRCDSKRWTQLFICEYPECDLVFKKWHNLFDHLRTHSKEKPFPCPVDECPKGFTQFSNLKKHVSSHSRKLYLKCSKCKKMITKARILSHFMKKECDAEAAAL